MKNSLGQELSSLYIPQSAGGQFPKSTVPSKQKLYLVLTTVGIQAVLTPHLRVGAAETPLAIPGGEIDALLWKETVVEENGQKKKKKESYSTKATIIRNLCGPFYDEYDRKEPGNVNSPVVLIKSATQKAKEAMAEARKREKLWGLITYDNGKERDCEGMVYVRKEKEEKKTKLDENWPMRGDADFE